MSPSPPVKPRSPFPWVQSLLDTPGRHAPRPSRGPTPTFVGVRQTTRSAEGPPTHDPTWLAWTVTDCSWCVEYDTLELKSLQSSVPSGDFGQGGW